MTQRDKGSLGRYFIQSGKDYEYDSIGSITGMTVNVKNDAPEKVLVKAMLTITTFGWNLCSEETGLSEETFKEIFKRQVLNGYKSLLQSELTQMYIRHVIRKGKMCPFTGIVKEEDKKQQPADSSPAFQCPLQPKHDEIKCPRSDSSCSYYTDNSSGNAQDEET